MPQKDQKSNEEALQKCKGSTKETLQKCQGNTKEIPQNVKKALIKVLSKHQGSTMKTSRK